MRLGALLFTVVFISAAAATASAQVTSITYYTLAGDDRVGFQSLGLTRGALNMVYFNTDVIMPSLNRINNVANVTVATPDGPTKDANAFLRDPYLNTGLESPGVG